MKYAIIQPPAILKKYVQYFWTITTEALPEKQFSIHTFVDDSSGVIFQHRMGKSDITKNGNLIPEAFVYGQTTTPTFTQASTGFVAAGARFFPFALYELFGIHALHFTNQLIPVSEFSHRNIDNIVRHTLSPAQLIWLMTTFLIHQLKTVNKEDFLIKQCIGQIRARKGLLTVENLRYAYTISERQLERRFNEVVGVSPRHYIKVIRLGEVISLFKTNQRTSLSEIAYDLQYSDQSHFVRHVKELTGLTPTQLKHQLSTAPVNLMI